MGDGQAGRDSQVVRREGRRTFSFGELPAVRYIRRQVYDGQNELGTGQSAVKTMLESAWRVPVLRRLSTLLDNRELRYMDDLVDNQVHSMLCSRSNCRCWNYFTPRTDPLNPYLMTYIFEGRPALCGSCSAVGAVRYLRPSILCLC